MKPRVNLVEHIREQINRDPEAYANPAKLKATADAIVRSGDLERRGPVADKRDPLELTGAVFAALRRHQEREATRDIITPLIARAKVSARLKEAALKVQPVSVSATDFEGWPAGEVRGHLASFVKDGVLVETADGVYERGTPCPELSGKTAARYVPTILKGWPDAIIGKVTAILLDGDKPAGDDDGDDDGDEE